MADGQVWHALADHTGAPARAHQKPQSVSSYAGNGQDQYCRSRTRRGVVVPSTGCPRAPRWEGKTIPVPNPTSDPAAAPDFPDRTPFSERKPAGNAGSTAPSSRTT